SPLASAARLLAEPTGPDSGFLRPEALLAVLFLTDEDDCSADDDSRLFTNDPAFGPLHSFRCARFGLLCDGSLPADQPRSYGGCLPARQDQGSKLVDVARYQK